MSRVELGSSVIIGQVVDDDGACSCTIMPGADQGSVMVLMVSLAAQVPVKSVRINGACADDYVPGARYAWTPAEALVVDDDNPLMVTWEREPGADGDVHVSLSGTAVRSPYEVWGRLSAESRLVLQFATSYTERPAACRYGGTRIDTALVLCRYPDTPLLCFDQDVPVALYRRTEFGEAVLRSAREQRETIPWHPPDADTMRALMLDEYDPPGWRSEPEEPPEDIDVPDDSDEMRRRLAQLEEFGVKVNAIRNSIVGHQSVNWSAHIYPLVAALGEAGFEGDGYKKARARAETQMDRIDRLETELQETRGRLSQAWDMMQNSGAMMEPDGRTGNPDLDKLASFLDEHAGAAPKVEGSSLDDARDIAMSGTTANIAKRLGRLWNRPLDAVHARAAAAFERLGIKSVSLRHPVAPPTEK